MEENWVKVIQEMKEKIMILEMRVRALEALRDADETYMMEQKERE